MSKIMKTNLLRLCLTALTLLVTSASYAEDVLINGIYYTLDNNTLQAQAIQSKSSKVKYEGHIELPESVAYNNRAYSVTSIGPHFAHETSTTVHYQISTLVVPKTVTYIDSFNSPSDSLILKDGNTSLKISLYQSAKYKYLYIGRPWSYSYDPDKKDSPFSGNANLHEVTINYPSPFKIGAYMFYDCTALEVFNTPSAKIVGVANYGFYKCTSLKSFDFTNIKYVLSYGFAASNISSLNQNLPILSQIGDYAFSDCESLTQERLLNAEIIGKYAFKSSTVESLVFGDNLKTIRDYAFSECSFLNHIALGNSVDSLGRAITYKCSRLTEIAIPQSVTQCADYVLSSDGISTVYWASNCPTSFYEAQKVKKVFVLTDTPCSAKSNTFKGVSTYPEIYVSNVSLYKDAWPDQASALKPLLTLSAPAAHIYNGEAPNIECKYNATECKLVYDQANKNVGNYTLIKTTFQKDEWRATCDIPCAYMISKRPLTIIADSPTIPYGKKIPALSYAHIGFAEGENESNLANLPTIVTTATQSSKPGTYPIYITGATAQNYEISYIPGTLTIEKAPHFINWEQDTQLVVGDQVELNATANSGAPISYKVSDESIAQVLYFDGKYWLNVNKAGKVVITATTSENECYQTALPVGKQFVIKNREISTEDPDTYDVDKDGKVSMHDVNVLIDYLLKQ